MNGFISRMKIVRFELKDSKSRGRQFGWLDATQETGLSLDQTWSGLTKMRQISILPYRRGKNEKKNSPWDRSRFDFLSPAHSCK